VVYVPPQLGIAVELLRVALQPVEHRCRSYRSKAWHYTLGPPRRQKISLSWGAIGRLRRSPVAGKSAKWFDGS
jgi:hypothetical protein